MSVIAKLRYLRIAPRKVRLVADLIRGKSVEEAQTILNFTQKKATLPISKLLRQAIANAKNNFQLKEENLFISEILVNEGPKLKRVFPRARGSADTIQKKVSHITLVLEEREKPKINPSASLRVGHSAELSRSHGEQSRTIKTKKHDSRSPSKSI